MTATYDGQATEDFKVGRWRLARMWVTGKAARAAGIVLGWRVTLALPGLAGAGLVSAGVAMRFGIWAGLIAGGVFALRIDSRVR